MPCMESHVSSVCRHLYIRVMSRDWRDMWQSLRGLEGAVWLWFYFQQAQQDMGTLQSWCFGEADLDLSHLS